MPSDIFGPWNPNGGDTGGSGTTPVGENWDTPALLSGTPFWDSVDTAVQFMEPGPWNRCQLGDRVLPGFCVVDVPGRERKVDSKDGAGKGGATQTIKGWSPSDVTITITMWTREQWLAWVDCADDFSVEDKDGDKPWAIFTPAAQIAGVSSILIKKVSAPKIANGIATVTINGSDWLAKPKVTGTSTPNSSKTSTGEVNAQDAWNAYLACGGAADDEAGWSDFKKKNKLPPGLQPPFGYPATAAPPAAPPANEWGQAVPES